MGFVHIGTLMIGRGGGGRKKVFETLVYLNSLIRQSP